MIVLSDLNENDLKEFHRTHIFYKDNENDKIWNVRHLGMIGEHLFSFDKNTVFNFWPDYPKKLTKEQIELFRKEQPDWARMKDD